MRARYRLESQIELKVKDREQVWQSSKKGDTVSFAMSKLHVSKCWITTPGPTFHKAGHLRETEMSVSLADAQKDEAPAHGQARGR